VSDVDVAVVLRPAHADRSAQEAAEEYSRHAAQEAGKQFGTFIERLFWPQVEVRQFLKDRKRISLHDLRADAPVVEGGTHAIVYVEGEVRRDALPILKEWSTERARGLREGAAKTKELNAAKRRASVIEKDENELQQISAKLEGFLQMDPEDLKSRVREAHETVAKARAVSERVERRREPRPRGSRT
jgi:hypothetical protein